MKTKLKIKINDSLNLRMKLDLIYQNKSQIELVKYAINLIKHISVISNCSSLLIDEAISTCLKWLASEISIKLVRETAFKVHKVARKSEIVVEQSLYRTIGQAISTCHVKEHAMIASDYAIKTINLLFPNDYQKVIEEREYQISIMKMNNINGELFYD